MPIKEVEKIWMNGKFIDWEDAKIHILTHVIHYGSSFFEGIRSYNSVNGPAIFRLDEHIERMIDSAKMYRADIPYTFDEIKQACIDTVAVNNLSDCYIRPVAYRGFGEIGVNPLKNPVDLVIAAYEWGSYLGKGALENGIDVCVSSWRRNAPDTTPAMAKIGGAYMNNQLIKMEAIVNGFVEGIALDINGYVSEGSGENIFLVKNGILYTPGLNNSILSGITRDTVIKLAITSGIEVVQTNIMREMLYTADEVFFSGTAAEITPIRSVDKIKVGTGTAGKLTLSLQEKFFDIVRNGNDSYGWLTYIQPVKKVMSMAKANQ